MNSAKFYCSFLLITSCLQKQKTRLLIENITVVDIGVNGLGQELNVRDQFNSQLCNVVIMFSNFNTEELDI